MLKENLLALNWAQLGPKTGQNEGLGHFLVQNALFLPILYIVIESYDI